jgi:peptidoglycan/LPS O-acetylase OafA/YrhL
MALADSGFPQALLAQRVVSATEDVRGSTARLAWVDAFRGIAILAVALIHTCGSLQKLRHAPDTAWFCFAELSRLLQFAVPAFLMLSACVLTRSLLREPSLKRYARHRVQSVLWPTIVWSLLCVPYAHSLKPGISWSNAARQVWTGEADFHLYFLRVLLQLCVILPLLMPLLRRRPPLWAVLLGATLLTLVFFLFNRFVLKYTNPASWIFWYVPPVALGLWLGTQSERWPEIARRGLVTSLAVSVIGGALYLPFALREMEGADVRALLYPISWWIYTTAMSFALFCGALWLCEKPFTALSPLRLLGKYSLQVYLLHPVILLLLEKQIEPYFWSGYASAPQLLLIFLWRFCLCLTVPLALTWLVENVRPSRLLFGR